MTTSTPQPLIKNPHLESDAFYWQGGPTGILLIHGFTATTAEVRPLAKALHSQGYTVSGPVLPGHNTFPEDLNRVRWQDWVVAMERAYLELAAHCERVFVGGESTGGLLALYLGSSHPKIAGLLLYAPALKLTLSARDAVKLRLVAPFVPYLPHQEKEDDGLAWKGYTVLPLKGAVQLLRLQKQVMPRLQRIQQPVLIVQGRLDDTVHPSVPQLIFDRVQARRKEIHWMEASTHCVILDRELDRVTAITLEFLGSSQQ